MVETETCGNVHTGTEGAFVWYGFVWIFVRRPEGMKCGNESVIILQAQDLRFRYS